MSAPRHEPELIGAALPVQRESRRVKQYRGAALRYGVLGLVALMNSGEVRARDAALVSRLSKEKQLMIVARGAQAVIEAAKEIRRRAAGGAT